MKRHPAIIPPSTEHDPETGVRWYNRLLEVIFSLDVFPERAPLAPESKSFDTEIREFSTVVANKNTGFFSH